MFYYYDATYILVLIGAALSLWASANVNSTLKKYQKITARSGLTAHEAAQYILQENGIYDVTIKMVSGVGSDYYSPSTKELCLLDTNYNSTSIGSIGVAAHECGHAIQDAEEYTPLTLQRSFAPVCSFGSRIGIYVVILGLMFSIPSIQTIGILLFSLGVAFSLLLLPIEFDASRRAVKVLGSMGMMNEQELSGVRKVLKAAALTYVAAAASAILSLLRLLIISQRGKNRR